MIEVIVQHLINPHPENPTKDSKPITSISRPTQLRPTFSSECELSDSNSLNSVSSEVEQADMSSFTTSKKHGPGPLSGRGNLTGGHASSAISSGARKMGHDPNPNKRILSSRVKGTQESLGVKDSSNVNEYSPEYKTTDLYGLALRNPEVSTTPSSLSDKGLVSGSPGVHGSPMSWSNSETSRVVPTGLVSGSSPDVDDVMLVCEDLEEFDMSVAVPTSALRSGDVGPKKGLPQGKPVAAEQAKVSVLIKCCIL